MARPPSLRGLDNTRTFFSHKTSSHSLYYGISQSNFSAKALQSSIASAKTTPAPDKITGNLALDNNLDVLVYIPPIRNDIKIPYNIKDYDNIMEWLRLT